MCIYSRESEAEFSAFLACEANESPEYPYFPPTSWHNRYCHMVLSQIDSAAAQELSKGCVKEPTWASQPIRSALQICRRSPTATYLAASGQHRLPHGERHGAGRFRHHLRHADGTASGRTIPTFWTEPEVPKFDPFGTKIQVDLSGIFVNAKPRPQPEATEGAA